MRPSSVVRDLGVLLDQEIGMTAHRESDIILFPSAAETPSDTSYSRSGARLSAGSLARLVEARLW